MSFSLRSGVTFRGLRFGHHVSERNVSTFHVSAAAKCDKEYVSAVETCAQSARKLLTPVNIWTIPYPTGHAAVFAPPNKLNLVATNT